MKASMQMYSGKIIDVLNLTPEDIEIKDIIHGLSKQQRFMGQMDPDYSVALHSVLCARLSYYNYPVDNDEQILWALIHDFQEAYIMDVPTPIKENLFFCDDSNGGTLIPFRDMEDEIFSTIIKALRIDCYRDRVDSNILYKVDKEMLNIEQTVFNGDIDKLKEYNLSIYDSIGKLTNKEAEVLLHNSYKELSTCLYYGKKVSFASCPSLFGI